MTPKSRYTSKNDHIALTDPERIVRSAHLLALSQGLLLHSGLLFQLPDLLALRVQAHLHQKHLALLGDELRHALLFLLPIVRNHRGHLRG